MDRLWGNEAKSRGIKIRIPPNGIWQKISIRRRRNEGMRERKGRKRRERT